MEEELAVLEPEERLLVEEIPDDAEDCAEELADDASGQSPLPVTGLMHDHVPSGQHSAPS